MDWGTVAAATASSVVSGGLIGGAVSYLVARRESDDRKEALAVERERLAHEREKWEHDRSAAAREGDRQTLVAALTWISDARTYLAVKGAERSEKPEDGENRAAFIDEALNEWYEMSKRMLALVGSVAHVAGDSSAHFSEAWKSAAVVAARLSQPGALPDDFPELESLATAASVKAERTLRDALRAL